VQVVATRHNVELARYLITQGARLDTTEHTNALSPIHIAAVRALTRQAKTCREHPDGNKAPATHAHAETSAPAWQPTAQLAATPAAGLC
jgi:hypothetical protein